jgi:hypothetical protein
LSAVTLGGGCSISQVLVKLGSFYKYAKGREEKENDKGKN